MKVFILLALLGVASAAVHHGVNEELNADWAAYKTEHGKSYDRAEELTRRTVWEQNLKKIQHHNIRASLGEHTYTLGMNKYGDMTTTEFVETMNGYAMAEKVKKSKGRSFMAPLNMKVAAFVDWRAEGYVTPVKDQGQCGSCWAFSATGSLEGQTYRKTGKLISLSEQNLIDCSRPQGNDGCDGGRSDYAFNYIAQVGIERERDYPYTAQDDSCVYDPSKKAAEDTGFVDIPSADEAALVAASVGPISVAIDASRDTFQLYAGGVYNEPACSSTDLNHGVLAVGYGNDSRGGDYYIVKNSWGEGWGLGGYILMARNRDNQCGIATDACYPIV